MSRPEIRRIPVSHRRLEDLAELLSDSTYPDAMADNGHLADEQLVSYCDGSLASSDIARVEQHLDTCAECAEEVSRLRQLASIWQDESAVAALEQRVHAVLWPAEASAAQGGRAVPEIANAIGQIFDAALDALKSPFAVSLKSMMMPQGAYGETKEEEATLEFFITQEGKIVDGLRGLLKRVNREYYVRIFAVDPGARSRYGDRKAVISISDTYQERPILHRKIDIGVTVLLGTDFRLTDNSCLAVEMLPSIH